MIDLLVYCRLLTGTVQKLADWYFHNGSPVLAACCHMSVDDCQVVLSGNSGSYPINAKIMYLYLKYPEICLGEGGGVFCLKICKNRVPVNKM